MKGAGTGGWGGFGEWHVLFDELCNRHGHFENARLAGELCKRRGKGGGSDFDTAQKALRDWRRGRRVPLRKNLAIVSDLFAVEADPDLSRTWNVLYRSARRRTGVLPSDGLARFARDENPMTRRQLWWALGGAGVLLGAGAAFALSSEHGRVDQGLPSVEYHGMVRVPIGASQLIHGEFKECGGSPPEWHEIWPRIPSSPLGVFSDGGLARKMVNVCGEEMVVRAVRFTALKPGTEEVTLLDDYMRIEVANPFR